MAKPGKKRLLSRADIADIYRAHAQGERQWQIAERYKVSQTTISRALADHPQYTPKTKPICGMSRAVKKKARIIQLAIYAGYTPKEIATHPKICLTLPRVRALAKLDINGDSPPPRNQK